MRSYDTPDVSWKERFITRLAALLILHGLSEDAAVAVASAHVNEQYASRKSETPEIDAEMVFAEMQHSKGWD